MSNVNELLVSLRCWVPDPLDRAHRRSPLLAILPHSVYKYSTATLLPIAYHISLSLYSYESLSVFFLHFSSTLKLLVASARVNRLS